MKLTTGVAAAAFSLAAFPVGAQPADFSSMDVKGTPSVIVTDRSGNETTGRLVVWTPLSVVVDSKGVKRPFTPAEAVRIDSRRDSLKNGIIIGAAFGASRWFHLRLSQRPELVQWTACRPDACWNDNLGRHRRRH